MMYCRGNSSIFRDSRESTDFDQMRAAVIIRMHFAVRPLCAEKSPVFSEGHWAAGANGDVFITASAMHAHMLPKAWLTS